MVNRFAMYLGEPMIELTMLIHTKYNEYDAVIRPMEAYLEKKGVRFRKGTRVRDIETEQKGKETLATGLVYEDNSGSQRIGLTRDDLVFFTNGSMVQKTTWGDNDTVVAYDRDTRDLGLFDVWKKLAARDPKFGRPEPFISDIEGSGFYTWTATIKGDSKFVNDWSAKTGVSQPLIKNAFTTIKDASWVPTCFVYGKNYYRGQPDDVNVAHGYPLAVRRRAPRWLTFGLGLGRGRRAMGSGSPPAARTRRVSRSENRECIESASERARVDHFCELRARARRNLRKMAKLIPAQKLKPA